MSKAVAEIGACGFEFACAPTRFADLGVGLRRYAAASGRPAGT